MSTESPGERGAAWAAIALFDVLALVLLLMGAGWFVMGMILLYTGGMVDAMRESGIGGLPFGGRPAVSAFLGAVALVAAYAATRASQHLRRGNRPDEQPMTRSDEQKLPEPELTPVERGLDILILNVAGIFLLLSGAGALVGGLLPLINPGLLRAMQHGAQEQVGNGPRLISAAVGCAMLWLAVVCTRKAQRLQHNKTEDEGTEKTDHSRGGD